MDIAFQVFVVLGLVEILVGIVFFVRGDGEALAGLSREEIAQRTRMKRLALPLVAGGLCMAIGAAVAQRLL